MLVVSELVASGVLEHVRMNLEWELYGFSGPGDRFKNPAVVAGPPRSLMKTYRESKFSPRS